LRNTTKDPAQRKAARNAWALLLARIYEVLLSASRWLAGTSRSMFEMCAQGALGRGLRLARMQIGNMRAQNG